MVAESAVTVAIAEIVAADGADAVAAAEGGIGNVAMKSRARAANNRYSRQTSRRRSRKTTSPRAEAQLC
jgi:hypothetical protein